jgi:hypothetical protein
MELHDKKMKDILSHSKLELPFSDFDERMIQRIEEFELKKQAAEKNKFYSHLCFLAGIILGTVLTYLMSEKMDLNKQSFLTKDSLSLLSQLVYVVLIVLFTDKLWKLSKFDFKKFFK